jgi:histidinol-phosphatase (PHP family)
MEAYVHAAISRGLREICFLGHHEQKVVYYRKNWMTLRELEQFVKECATLKKKYAGTISILTGMELGINVKRLKELQSVVTLYPFDLVGLSYHYLEWDPRFINVCSPRKECIDAFELYDRARAVLDYYRTIDRALDVIDADFLCHFDVIRRNHPDLMYTGEVMSIIHEILRKVKLKHMSIEINTSGFDHRNEQYPSTSLVREIMSMGIPLCAGSDSHHPSEVGRYFDRIPSLIETVSSDLQRHLDDTG